MLTALSVIFILSCSTPVSGLLPPADVSSFWGSEQRTSPGNFAVPPTAKGQLRARANMKILWEQNITDPIFSYVSIRQGRTLLSTSLNPPATTQLFDTMVEPLWTWTSPLNKLFASVASGSALTPMHPTPIQCGSSTSANTSPGTGIIQSTDIITVCWNSSMENTTGWAAPGKEDQHNGSLPTGQLFAVSWKHAVLCEDSPEGSKTHAPRVTFYDVETGKVVVSHDLSSDFTSCGKHIVVDVPVINQGITTAILAPVNSSGYATLIDVCSTKGSANTIHHLQQGDPSALAMSPISMPGYLVYSSVHPPFQPTALSRNGTAWSPMQVKGWLTESYPQAIVGAAAFSGDGRTVAISYWWPGSTSENGDVVDWYTAVEAYQWPPGSDGGLIKSLSWQTHCSGDLEQIPVSIDITTSVSPDQPHFVALGLWGCGNSTSETKLLNTTAVLFQTQTDARKDPAGTALAVYDGPGSVFDVAVEVNTLTRKVLMAVAGKAEHANSYGRGGHAALLVYDNNSEGKRFKSR